MQVRLYTSADDYAIASVDIPRVPADVPSPFEFYLSLAQIAAGAGDPFHGAGSFGDGVNLHDIRAIEWFANGSANFDAAIEEARENLQEGLELFFETASPKEIRERHSGKCM